MLALRLTRVAHPAVQLRRLLVAAASAGTGFLLLSALGYAMSHPDSPAAATLRLAWCAPPLAATIHLAVAVARTDPGTRPRPGLAAAGLGPGRLMLVSATTTALSCLLGSMLALLVFLHLRGDLTGMPFDGDASQFLAADSPLPLPAALTLLALTPALASAAVALLLRPKLAAPAARRAKARPHGRFGVSGRSADRETFGAYGRFGARLRDAVRGGATTPDTASAGRPPGQNDGAPQASAIDPAPAPAEEDGSRQAPDDLTHFPVPRKPPAGLLGHHHPHRGPGRGDLRRPRHRRRHARPPHGPAHRSHRGPGRLGARRRRPRPRGTRPHPSLRPGAPGGTAWAAPAPGGPRPHGGSHPDRAPPRSRVRGGRRRLRVGPRPDSAATAAIGPLSALGATVVAGATVTTLFMAALEARQARADTTAALLRLGAPTAMLRSAAALRAGVLLAVFGPLTLIVAELAALPLAAR